jgi:hypothetical protein
MKQKKKRMALAEWRGLEADFSARSSALRARTRAPSGLPDASSCAASADQRRASTRGAVRLRSTRTCLTTLQNPAGEWTRMPLSAMRGRAPATPGLRDAAHNGGPESTRRRSVCAAGRKMLKQDSAAPHHRRRRTSPRKCASASACEHGRGASRLHIHGALRLRTLSSLR